MAILNRYRKIQDELGIIGDSEQIRELVELVMSIAPTNITVLITGESGVGKEVFSKAIHQLSPRSNQSLVTVNCGAIPEGLLESELFGHEKGAFTGAVGSKKGYFELADKGTIFLDEIGEMALQTQVKLLRVLESGEFMRVGSGELQKVDVRVIAATNRRLEQMVESRDFRKDLYYRLKAVEMNIPPLRERLNDVPSLIEFFLEEITSRENITFAGFSPEAEQIIRSYQWPGNIRELRNFVDSVAILAKGEVVGPDLVREQLRIQDKIEMANTLPIPLGQSVEEAERELIYKALVSLGMEVKEMKTALRQFMDMANGNGYQGTVIYSPVSNEELEIKPLDDLEREMIEKALDKFRGNRRKVARALNISERTLYRKIKEYNLTE